MNREIERKIAELEYRKSKVKTSNIFHFLMTILTGFWVFVWIFAALLNKKERDMIDREIFKLKLKAYEI